MIPALKRIGTWLAFLGLGAGVSFVFWMALASLAPSPPERLAPLPKPEELGMVLPLQAVDRKSPRASLERRGVAGESLSPPEELRRLEEEGIIVY